MTQTLTLNTEQEEAVHAIGGPVLVIAGPGTGKTHLLSLRAAHIMKAEKVPGENILVLTYTNSAAKSVKERLGKIVGPLGYRIYAETFHGFANSLLLDSEEASDYLREKIQITDVEKIKCFEYILDNFPKNIKELRPFGKPYLYLSEIQKRISDLKNEGILPENFEKEIKLLKPDGFHIEEKHIPRLKELSFIYKKYEEIKASDTRVFDKRGRYDYDDMIGFALKVLKGEPEVRKAYTERFKYVMVDEFQDTNGAQLKLLFSLVEGKSPNLCCVGDDDQSIYRFQGASVANFKILKERFPDIKTIRLKNNYRSTKEIVNLSSAIIAEIPLGARLEKNKRLLAQKDYKNKRIEFTRFSCPDEEIMFIIKMISSIAGAIESDKALPAEERKKPFNQIAVLVRKRKDMPRLIDGFLRSGIPYATDGKEDIAGHRRVKQMIQILQLAHQAMKNADEKDLTLYKVLSSDFFQIQSSVLMAFIDRTNREKKSVSTFSAFLSSFPAEISGKQPSDRMNRASWAIQRLLIDADTRPVHDMLMGFIEDADIYKFILREYDKNKILIMRELRALTAFVNMVKNYSLSRPEITLTDFLEEVELLATHNMPVRGRLVTATQNGVRLITAHSSKGLEFHTCFIPFCIQDKNWPLKPLSDRIPLPGSILKSKHGIKDKAELKRLAFFDETRLFYVASSRAKSNLIFSSSPTEDNISSSYLDNIGLAPTDGADSEEELLSRFFKEKKEGPLPEDTKDVLDDIVKGLTLTPTKINNYLRCKRRFLYDNVLLLPGRKKQSLVFGNCAHKALEETYRLYKRTKRFPDFPFFKSVFKNDLEYQAVTKKIRSQCLAKLESLGKWYKAEAERPIVPLELEKKKIVTLKGGIALSGKFDKIEFEDKKNKTIRVVDYKTGAPDRHVKKLGNSVDLESEDCDDYMRQLIAYKLLYEKDIHEPPLYKVSHGTLVFLEPAKNSSLKHGLTKGTYVNKKTEITNEMVDKFEKLVLNIWKKINALEFDKFPERDKEKCRGCDYDDICWESK
ncbi:MAG: ATP-dependent helicase [Candidatus Omnitrophica bacterium]|nr:ATP-dependent helicase [Candidatus Omnitrophota bacterium]